MKILFFQILCKYTRFLENMTCLFSVTYLKTFALRQVIKFKLKLILLLLFYIFKRIRGNSFISRIISKDGSMMELQMKAKGWPFFYNDK